MAARLCIRDVGRAMNYSYAEVDRVAKMIPTMLGITIEKALDMNPELKAAYDTDDSVKTLIDVSKTLEGLPHLLMRQALLLHQSHWWNMYHYKKMKII